MLTAASSIGNAEASQLPLSAHEPNSRRLLFRTSRFYFEHLQSSLERTLWQRDYALAESVNNPRSRRSITNIVNVLPSHTHIYITIIIDASIQDLNGRSSGNRDRNSLLTFSGEYRERRFSNCVSPSVLHTFILLLERTTSTYARRGPSWDWGAKSLARKFGNAQVPAGACAPKLFRVFAINMQNCSRTVRELPTTSECNFCGLRGL